MSKNPDLGKTGNSVWNQPFIDELNANFFPNMDVNTMQNEQDRFLEFYPEWIASSKLNQFRGLEDFPKRYVSLGVTQALDWWHNWCLSQGLRLKMFRGEYPYNRDVWLGEYMGWDKSIDDIGLDRGDAVIISVPFSGSGRKHERWKWLIEECNTKDIPVFVDCAWFGTCFDVEVKLNHPCIKMVAFSTGKGLSCGNWRSGIVFSRLADDDRCSLELQTEWRHGIHLNVAIANHLMAKYGPDTMPKKYMEAHAAVCEHYGFETTNTIHIAVAPQTPEWREYHRDETFNRVNIAKAIKRWKSNGNFAQ
jgi:hypothetical protein